MILISQRTQKPDMQAGTGPRSLVDSSPSAMSPDLRVWTERVRDEVERQFPPQVRKLYNRDENRRHFQDLAVRLERGFQDPVLARSGFLHGIPSYNLRQLSGLVTAEVRAVLEEREKLYALDPRDKDVREQLLANVLPALSEARAIVLFVLEQLHHLDPGGVLTEWSRTFHRQPQPPPPDFASGPSLEEGLERQVTPLFVGSVVAPIAEFFGLWLERDALEDAVALLFQRPLAERVLTFVQTESRPGGACAELVRIVEKPLTDLGVEATWEWHHLGSLVRRLPPTLARTGEPAPEDDRDAEARAWKRFLFRAGAIQLRCPDHRECYEALGRLHQTFTHRPTEVEDSLGRVEAPGHRRIRTVLIQPGEIFARELPGERPAVTVLLASEKDLSLRHRPTDRRHLEEIRGRLRSGERGSLRVFAPDGGSWDLPTGATVLEFAAAVNHRWLVHLAGATVNRRPVSLLHHLEPGDVVWLDLSEESWPLPRGWQECMTSAEVRKRIGREFRYHYRPALESEGRRWLREKLRAQGVARLPEDKHLDLLLEDAEKAVAHFKHRPGSPALLRQLGLLAAQKQGMELPYRLSIDETLAERLVAQTALEIQKTGLIEVNDLDLPEDLHAQTERVVLCPDCEPVFDQELVGTLEGGTLSLHAPGSPCADGGVPVSRLRILTRPQYFVLEARNRVGLGAEILDVFRRHAVGVTDFVGMEEGRQWAIVRVGIERVSQGVAEELLRELRQIPGIERWAPPEAGEAPDWESPLPPRQPLGATAWSQAEPYVCGNDITEDVYFYGMSRCRAHLRKLFGETINPAVGQGRTGFVHGPKRAGKTSLAKLFLREVERGTSRPCVTAYYEAPTGYPWSWVEKQVQKEIHRRATKLAERLGRDLPQPPGSDLVELVEHVQDHLGCTVVLVLDEVTTLFASSSDPREVAAIAALRSRIEALPCLLVLWTGPLAQVSTLPRDLQLVLQRSEQVPMERLSLTETQQLLAAENFGSKVRIKVPYRVAEQVHSLTGGNPYWTSLLGGKMWRIAPRRKDGLILYRPPHLEAAVSEVIREGVSFADRLASPATGSYPGLAKRILTAMATQSPDEKEPVWSLKELHQVLQRRGAAVPPDKLRQTLRFLESQGSVRETRLENRPFWTIAAPLLTEYLRYSHSDEEAEGDG